MPVILKQLPDWRSSERIEGEFFYGKPSLALNQAQEYAGEYGSVLSLPPLLHAVTLDNYSEFKDHHTMSRSEEYWCKSPEGKDKVVVLHGGGILNSPERIKNLSYERGQAQDYIMLGEKEVVEFIKNNKINMIPIDDVMKERVKEFPAHYGIFMALDRARGTKSGPQEVDSLYENPLYIARAGSARQAREHIRWLRDKNKSFANHHGLDELDNGFNKGRFLIISGDGTQLSSFGCYGDARFAATKSEGFF
ncbi:MAG: hypothetical protein JSV39_04985 [Candidatus Aenigmatarchaeota archaeon]|nr:MAG: hypothetical protein JSV39_04985 [Candidatus Aenigmarchaeota archaeon]